MLQPGRRGRGEDGVLSASLVLYNTPNEQIQGILRCLKNSTLRPHLYIIDNSPEPRLLQNFQESWITYIAPSGNLGYGGGHNVALRRILESSSFHLILNPDIEFGPAELDKLVAFAESDRRIGLVMPKVIYPDGSLQFLCKLIPTPVDLFIRRLRMPFLRRFMQDRMERFELRFSGYNHVMDVPGLSGCFMLLRTTALRSVGLFDERFLMYLEDFDLSRRIHARFRTVYFPGAVVVHDHGKYSYRSWRGLWMHIKSAVKYFNKWGWFYDPARTKANRITVDRIVLQLQETPFQWPEEVLANRARDSQHVASAMQQRAVSRQPPGA